MALSNRVALTWITDRCAIALKVITSLQVRSMVAGLLGLNLVLARQGIACKERRLGLEHARTHLRRMEETSVLVSPKI